MSSAIACSVAAHSPCNVAYPLIWDPVLGAARAPKVLLLWDDVRHVDVLDLDAQGFDVTVGGHYKDYVGVDFSAYDVVLWLNAYQGQYGLALQPGVDAALSAWVAGGGGLIWCGWGIWSEGVRVYQGNPILNPLCLALCPVYVQVTQGVPPIPQYRDSNAIAWTREVGASFAAEGIPDTIPGTDVRGGQIVVYLKANSYALYTGQDTRIVPRIPTFAYTTQYGGCSIYINDTLNYGSGAHARTFPALVPTTVKQLYYNAVRFAAQKAANP